MCVCVGGGSYHQGVTIQDSWGRVPAGPYGVASIRKRSGRTPVNALFMATTYSYIMRQVAQRGYLYPSCPSSTSGAFKCGPTRRGTHFLRIRHLFLGPAWGGGLILPIPILLCPASTLESLKSRLHSQFCSKTWSCG